MSRDQDPARETPGELRALLDTEEAEERAPESDLPGMWEPSDLVNGWADTDGRR